MRVVVGLSWPSHRAMTVMSTPAWSRFIAAVCRKVCGVTFLACRGDAGARCCRGVFGDHVCDGVVGQRGSTPGAEQRLGPGRVASGEPAGEDLHGVGCERSAAIF